MRRPRVLIPLAILVVLVAAAVTYQRAVAGPSPVVSDAPLLGAPTAAARLTPSAALHVAESQGDGSLLAQAAQVTVKYGVWKPELVRAGLMAPINVWVVTLTGLSTVPGPAGSALPSGSRCKYLAMKDAGVLRCGGGRESNDGSSTERSFACGDGRGTGRTGPDGAG